jgi:spore coat polysaccharide biosynthesis protein SpsF
MEKTVAIIQARMGSTRLPGKVLKEIMGKPILWHIIERVKQSALIDEIMIATTNNKNDDELEIFLKDMRISCFRGSEDNVLERFYLAAKSCNATAVLRLTGDNPLVDSQIIDETISFFRSIPYRYVTTTELPEGKRTLPIGLGCEIFTFDLLEEAYMNSSEDYEKEHVTPYMYYRQNSIGYYCHKKGYSNYRFTVDTIEDYKFVSAIYNKLYLGKHDFYLNDIVQYVNSYPELSLINAAIKQKGI